MSGEEHVRARLREFARSRPVPARPWSHAVSAPRHDIRVMSDLGESSSSVCQGSAFLCHALSRTLAQGDGEATPDRNFDVSPRESAAGRDAPSPDSIRRMYRMGRELHPGLEVPWADFARALLRRGAIRQTESRLLAADLYLVAACEAGAPRAWQRVWERHGSGLCRRARALGADPVEARELAVDVVSDLWRRSSGERGTAALPWSGRGSFARFLAVIARRRFLRLRRRGARERTGADLDACPGWGDPAVEAERADERGSVRDRLIAAAATMTSRERQVLRWKYLDGRSQREIARRLGVGEPRISRIHARAIERLGSRPARSSA